MKKIRSILVLINEYKNWKRIWKVLGTAVKRFMEEVNF